MSDPQISSQMMWVPDKKDVWRLSSVLSLTSSTVTIPTTGNESPASSQFASPPRPSSTTLSLKDVHVWDPSHAVLLDDMAKINDLHEAKGYWPIGMNDRIVRLIRAIEAAHGIKGEA